MKPASDHYGHVPLPVAPPTTASPGRLQMMHTDAYQHKQRRQHIIRIKQQPPATFYNDPKSRTFRVVIDVDMNSSFRDTPPGTDMRLGISVALTYADGSLVADQGALLCRAAAMLPPNDSDGDSDSPGPGAGILSLARTADATSHRGVMCFRCPQHEERQRTSEPSPDWQPVEFKFYLAHVSSRVEHGNRAFKLRFAATCGGGANCVGPDSDGYTQPPRAAPVCTSPILVLAKDPLKRKRGPKYHKHRACRAALRAAKRAAKSANAAAQKALRCARVAKTTKARENKMRSQLQHGQQHRGHGRRALAPPAHEPAPKRRQLQLHCSTDLPPPPPLAPTLSPVLVGASRYAQLAGPEAGGMSPLWATVTCKSKPPAACSASEWQSLALALGDAPSEPCEPCASEQSEQSEQSEPEPDAIDMDMCIGYELLDDILDLEPDLLGL